MYFFSLISKQINGSLLVIDIFHICLLYFCQPSSQVDQGYDPCSLGISKARLNGSLGYRVGSERIYYPTLTFISMNVSTEK